MAGTFTNTADPQTVKIASAPEARYFKLVAKSEMNGKAWASAAELGITASAVIDSPETGDGIPVVSGTDYYIKENTSGLYLQRKDNSEGSFCLNALSEADETFVFRFTLVDGFTSFYQVKSGDAYMNKGEGGWRCSAGSVTDVKDGWMQLETQGKSDYKMRGLWMTGKYLNFDRFTANSYVYADKASGAVFTLEAVNGTGVSEVRNADDLVAVYPCCTQGRVNVHTSGEAKVRVMNLNGTTLADYRTGGDLVFDMNYADGIYLVQVDTLNPASRGVYKILLNK